MTRASTTITSRAARSPSHLRRLCGTRLPRLEVPLHASVGNEPHDGHAGEDQHCQPGVNKGQRDAAQVQDWRDLALEVAPESLTETATALDVEDRQLQGVVRQCGKKQVDAVDDDRRAGELRLVHPGCGDGEEREPEQQVEVAPQDGPVDALDNLEHVMVVAPVDADVDEAEQVGQELRGGAAKRLEGGLVRDLQLQNHDGDDDGEDAVAKRFEPTGSHIPSLSGESLHTWRWPPRPSLGLPAYLIQAGMIEHVSVHNHARGAPLVVVTLMLVMFTSPFPARSLAASRATRWWVAASRTPHIDDWPSRVRGSGQVRLAAPRQPGPELREDADIDVFRITQMLWPARPGVGETRPEYPRDAIRR